MRKCGLLSIIFLGSFFSGDAQQILKKVQKAAERGVERTAERRVERESSKKTDQALDEIFDPKKPGSKEKTKTTETGKEGGSQTAGATKKSGNTIVTGSSFFTGGEIIYHEDFSKDALGDFPAGWETNSGGEIITLNEGKALRFYPNAIYLPGTGELPENYAIEFDLSTENFDYKGSSGTGFEIRFSESPTLERKAATGAKFRMPLWYNAIQKVYVENWGPGISIINNDLNFNIDSKINTTTHFTAVVNGKRLRLYIDDQKVVDLPTFLHGRVGRYASFYLNGTKPDEYNHIVAISDIRITREGQDLRSQILKGGFSTTQILFATASDKIQPGSYGFLEQLAQVLLADKSLELTIVGHTDSDGDEATNLLLSQKRAASVKNFLEGKGIGEQRLETSGKGETDPVATNDSEAGKAQNRRVEFIRR